MQYLDRDQARAHANIQASLCNTSNHLSIVTVRDGNWVETPFTVDNIDETLDKALFENEAVDSYISVNSLYRNHKCVNTDISSYRNYRSEGTVNFLNAIYIDLDLPKGMTTEQAKEELNTIHFGKTMPHPSVIVNSGRGLWLYWIVGVPATPKVKRYYKAIQAKLKMTLKQYGADASDISRVARLAGTINTKTGTMATLELHSLAKETFDTFADMLGMKKERAKRNQVKKTNQLHKSRLADMERLAEIRGMDAGVGHHRYLLMAQYASEAYKRGGYNCMIEKSEDLNSKFKVPLSDARLQDAYSLAFKDYKITTEKLSEVLAITEQEAKEMDMIKTVQEIKADRYVKANKERKRQASKKQKAEALKDSKVMQIAETAKKYGVTRQTIGRWLRQEQKEAKAEKETIKNDIHTANNVPSKKRKTATSEFDNADSHVLLDPTVFYNDTLSITAKKRLATLHNLTNDNMELPITYKKAMTGRLYALPGLTTLPGVDHTDGEIRRAIIAHPGNILIDGDFSQAEPRILANLSKDMRLTEIFRSRSDLYKEISADLLNKAYSEISKPERKIAKYVFLATSYGMSIASLAKLLTKAGINTNNEQAAAYMKTFQRKYPEAYKYLKNETAKAFANGYIKTITGRVIPVTGTRKRIVTKSKNYGMQGSVADLLDISIATFIKQIQERGLHGKVVLTVFDEILVECPESEKEVTIEILHNAMTQAIKLDVEIEVEIGTGGSWYDTKK